VLKNIQIKKEMQDKLEGLKKKEKDKSKR